MAYIIVLLRKKVVLENATVTISARSLSVAQNIAQTNLEAGDYDELDFEDDDCSDEDAVISILDVHK